MKDGIYRGTVRLVRWSEGFVALEIPYPPGFMSWLSVGIGAVQMMENRAPQKGDTIDVAVRHGETYAGVIR